MLSSTGRIFVLLLSCVSLHACGHSEEVNQIATVPAYYQIQSQKGVEAVTTPGFVSRYERQPIVTGGMNANSECGKNFSGIMDHLEGLMSVQIAQNNEIAARQAAIPNYRF